LVFGFWFSSSGFLPFDVLNIFCFFIFEKKKIKLFFALVGSIIFVTPRKWSLAYRQNASEHRGCKRDALAVPKMVRPAADANPPLFDLFGL